MYGNEKYDLSAGSALTINATIVDGTGAPISYAGSEVLSTNVWPGGSLPVLFSAGTSWVTPSAGTIQIGITAAQSATLGNGRYQLLTRVILSPGSDPLDAYGAWIEILTPAGSGVALTNYCAFQDLLDRAPWIEKLQKPTDLAGFATQRYLARQWFEDIVYRHYRGSSGLLTDFYFVPGISFGGRFGEAVYYRDGRRSSDLQGWLNANRLDVTTPVIEANACYAIASICDRQVDPGKDNDSYAAMARKWFKRAEDAAQNITVELDTNGDGINDTVVRLGIADTLEG